MHDSLVKAYAEIYYSVGWNCKKIYNFIKHKLLLKKKSIILMCVL